MDKVLEYLAIPQTAIAFMAVITLLVFVHELGHYWVAKLFGMKIDAFAIMMGGKRQTDLTGYLQKPLLPGKWLWLIGAISLALMLVGSAERWSLVRDLGMLSVGVVIPILVGTRIGTLYQTPKFEPLFKIATAWVVALGLLYFGTRFQNLDTSQILNILMAASYVGLLFVYYLPVAGKTEESEFGQGELKINGQSVEVLFRPLWCRKNAAGTEFSLLMLPLGGFAKIHGMEPKLDGSETEVEGGFYSKSPLARLAVLFAGPFFSIAFGVGLLTLMFATVGVSEASNKPVIGAVGPDSAAYRAGLKEGDVLIQVGNKKIATFYEAIQIVRVSPGIDLPVVYSRNGKIRTTVVRPEVDIQPSQVLDSSLKPTDVKKIQAKWGATWSFVRVRRGVLDSLQMTWEGIASFFSKPAEMKNDVGGPATIAVVAYEASQEGIDVLLVVAASLSISLGIMNLLPIAPLDGGQMVVAFVELLRRGKRLSIKVQSMVSSIGLLLIVALFVSVMAMDVKRFFGPKEKTTIQVKAQTTKH